LWFYHGTSARAAPSIVQGGFRPSGIGLYGPGIYLTTNKATAKRYATTTGKILLVEVEPTSVFWINQPVNGRSKIGAYEKPKKQPEMMYAPDVPIINIYSEIKLSC